MQQEKASANNSGASKTTSKSAKLNGNHMERVDSNTQLSKHLKEEHPSFTSMKFEGSKATLVTIVSDSLLAGVETDKKLTQINEEEETSIAAEVSSDEGHSEQYKIFTLGPDTNDSDSNQDLAAVKSSK